MGKRLNQSDPTANTAVSNVMKSGGASRPVLTIEHVEDHCLIRGGNVQNLLARLSGNDSSVMWSPRAQAFIVPPDVGRKLAEVAPRLGYEVTSR